MAQAKAFLDAYLAIRLRWRILAALIGGAALGLALAQGSAGTIRAFADNSRFFGEVFTSLLRMVVLPVIVFALITGVARITPAQLGRIGVKIMGFYLLCSALAVAVGLAFARLFRPGAGLAIVADGAANGDFAVVPKLGNVLLSIVPTNPAEALANGDVLPISLFALVFGLALARVRTSTNPSLAHGAQMLLDLTNAAAEAMYKIIRGIMEYAPIGVFFLIAPVFALQGVKAFAPLLMVTMAVYLGLLFHLLVIYGGFLAIFELRFFRFLRAASEAMITAFVTRSSNATLPVAMRICEVKLGIPRSIAAVTLPLGATVNMDGTAIYLGVCAMFIGYATGHPLTMDQQLTVIITATLASIGTAGMPGAGAVMLLLVLESIGLKVETGSAVAAAYAMILSIDAVLDMGRTSLNVTGDIAGSAIVAKTENAIDLALWSRGPASGAAPAALSVAAADVADGAKELTT